MFQWNKYTFQKSQWYIPLTLIEIGETVINKNSVHYVTGDDQTGHNSRLQKWYKGNQH